jgi:hypothetical protein
LLRVDKLIPEVMQHYPNEPVDAMKYLMTEYEIDTIAASHLVSVIWSYLDMQYPMNLPNFLVNPYGIHKN